MDICNVKDRFTDYLGKRFKEYDDIEDIVEDLLKEESVKLEDLDDLKDLLIEFADSYGEDLSNEILDKFDVKKTELTQAIKPRTEVYFEEDIAKSDDKQDIKDRQDVKKSYLAQSFNNYSDYVRYINWIDSELNDIIIRYKDDKNNTKGVYSTNSLNEAIKQKIRSLVKRLSECKIGTSDSVIQVELKKLENFTFDKTGFDILNDILSKYATILSGNDESKFIYTLLTKFDASLKFVHKSGIGVPSGSFNHLVAYKNYTYNVNSTHIKQGWTTDEDHDHFEEISDIIPRALRSIPVYHIQNEEIIDNNAVKQPTIVDYIKLDFYKVIDSFNLLTSFLYDHVEVSNQNILNFTLYDEQKVRLKKILTTDNLKNIIKSTLGVTDDHVQHIIDTHLKDKTFQELLLSKNDDIEMLMPIILGIIFKHPNASQLRQVLFKQHSTSYNYLYSVYKGVYEYNNSESFVKLENDQSEIDSQKISSAINQVLLSTTRQVYERYVYDHNKKITKREELQGKAVTYEENAFTRRLEGMHRAANPILIHTQPINLNNISAQGEEYDSRLGFKISVFKTDDKIQFQISQDDLTITFDANGTINGSLNDVDSLLAPNGIFYENLSKILPVNPNPSFWTQVDNNLALRNDLNELIFVVLGRSLANELINQPKDHNEHMKVLLQGSLHQSDSIVKGFSKPFGASDFKTRKFDFQLSLVTKQKAHLIKSIVDLDLASQGLVTSSMVVDSAKKQLNTNKLAAQGNKTLEGTYDQRKLVTNPNSHFMLYSVYKGGAVLRDYATSTGDILSAEDFNAAEHLSANFIVDYLAGFGKSNTIATAGAVVSDKPYIYRISTGIDRKLKYGINDAGVLVETSEETITLRDILTNVNSTQLIQQLERFELGKFYKKQYDFVVKQLNLINDKLEDANFRLELDNFLLKKYGMTFNQFFDDEGNIIPLKFDILENFKSFNDATKKGDKKSSKKFRQDVIHYLCRHIPELTFIDNLVGYYDKDGNLCSNPLLIDLNLRYNTDHANDIINGLSEDLKKKYGWDSIDPTNIYSYGETYFKQCQSQIISDILKNDYSLGSISENYFQDGDNITWPKFGGVDLKKHRFVDPEYGFIRLGSLKYNKNGKEEEVILNGKLSLQGFDPYKKLNKLARLITDDLISKNHILYTSLKPEKTLLSSAKFDIDALIGVLNSEEYRKYSAVYDVALERLKKFAKSNKNITLEQLQTERFITDTEINRLKTKYLNKTEDELNKAVVDYILNHPQVSYLDTLYADQTINPSPELNVTIEHNNLITDYNQASILLNQEHLNITVGSYLNHPIKGNTLDEITKNCVGAQTKRNVTFSATKHQYLYNTLRGIPKELNIAIIDNMYDSVFNLVGDGIGENSVQQQITDDGATYVVGPMNYLENWSLESAGVGVDKKQFGGYVNPESGSGDILKTAGFALTQDRLRASKFRQTLNRKMLSIPWLEGEETFNGNKFVDFTKDYKGNEIKLSDWGIVYAESSVDKNGEVTNQFYKVTDVKINNDGICTITTQEIDKFGKNIPGVGTSTNNIIINDNYTLWKKVFGGMYACHLSKINGKLQYTYKNCDKANENLARLSCLVGESRTGGNITTGLHTQTTVRQILKEKMIHYAPTDGAFKQGPANRNTVDQVKDDGLSLCTMKMGATDLGVQLNAEHEIIKQHVALMTQVMNAAAARGYSIKQGNEIYDALYKLTHLAIKECFEGFNSIDNSQKAKAYESLASLILESLKKTDQTESNLLQSFANSLRSLRDSEGRYDFVRRNLPIDDPRILRKILSNVVVSFQKQAVKLRFPGNQLVLVPSNGQMLMYDGRTMDDFGGNYKKMQYYLKAKQQNRRNDENRSFDVKESADLILGRTYEYQDPDSKKWVTVKLDNPWVYWEFKKKFENQPVPRILEYLPDGADLGCFNFKFNGTWTLENGTNATKKFQIWDLLSVRKKWNFEISDKSHLTEEEVKERRAKLQAAIQKDLQILGDTKDGDEIEIYNGDITENDKIIGFTSNKVTIDRQSVESIPFDQILPKTFKDIFGLTEEDSLYKIKENRNFFLFRALQQIKKSKLVTKTGLPQKYDIALIGTKSTMYLRHTTSIDSVTDLTDFTERDLKDITKEINGKWYRIDPASGNIMYSIPYINTDNESKPNIRIFTKYNYETESEEEIIVTDDINHFINQRNYTYIDYNIYDNSEESNEHYKELLEHLSKSDIGAIQKLLSLCEKDSKKSNKNADDNSPAYNLTKFKKLVKDYNENVNDLSKDQTNKIIEVNKYSPLLKQLIKHSSDMMGSFLDSLDCIASRTPAQCHQSFMTTRTVAFDTSETNSAYVSRWQLWLQGSDFDIDKINIITYNIKNGRLQRWSPFQRYHLGETYLKFANLLPLPSGQKLQFIDISNNKTGAQSNETNNSSNEKVVKLEDIPGYTELETYLKNHLQAERELADAVERLKSVKSINNQNDSNNNVSQNSSYIGNQMQQAFAAAGKQIDTNPTYLLIQEYLTKAKSLENYLKTYYGEIFSKELDENGKLSQNTIQVIDKCLEDEYVQGYFKDPTRSTEFIYLFNNLMQNIPTEQTFQQGQFNTKGTIAYQIREYIDKHNLYLQNVSLDNQKEIYQNFISRRIQQISSNPINWIQGQAPIDVITGPWQDLAELSKQAENSKRFVNRSIISTFEQLILTLEGKANVGIVANSLKVFEALSHHIYNTLAFGSLEDIKQLRSDLKIHGKVLQLAANTWCSTDRLAEFENSEDEEIKLVAAAIKGLNQNLDAYTELSVLLSLAVDNAKNPTLSKINGSQKMIGLYTAGVMAGLTNEDLIDIINSDTGHIINELLQGNRFVGKTPLKSIKDAINYLRKNPFRTTEEKLYSDVIDELHKVFDNDTIILFLDEHLGSLYDLKTGAQVDFTAYDINKYATCIRDILIKFIEITKEKANSEQLTDLYNELERDKRLPEANTLKNNLIKIIKGFKQFKDDIDIKLLNKFVNTLSQYHSYLSTVNFDTYDTLKEEKDELGNTITKQVRVRRIEDLSKLYKINQECQMGSFFTALNQGYANSIEEQIAFISQFQSLLSDHYTAWFEDDDPRKEDRDLLCSISNAINEKLTGHKSDYFVSFKDFIYDTSIKLDELNLSQETINTLKTKFPSVITNDQISYRELMTQIYETSKILFNPYKMVRDVKHYKGYLEGMYTAYESSKKISHIYEQVTKYAADVYQSLRMFSKAEKEVVIKNMIKFFQRNNTIDFFEHDAIFENFFFNSPIKVTDDSSDITPYSLQNEIGREAFKLLFETKILPELQALFPENSFIQSLRVEVHDQTSDHNPTSMVRTSISTIIKNEIEREQYNNAKHDLYKLQNQKYNQLNIVSLLYLYNLISTEGLAVPGSFGMFFEDIESDRSNKVVNAYIDFIKTVSDKDEKDKIVTYNENELPRQLKIYCAPVVSHYAQNVKSDYVYVYDKDKKKTILLVKTPRQKNVTLEFDYSEIIDQAENQPRTLSPVGIFQENNSTAKYYYAIANKNGDPLKQPVKPNVEKTVSNKGKETWKISGPVNITITELSGKSTDKKAIQIELNGKTYKISISGKKTIDLSNVNQNCAKIYLEKLIQSNEGSQDLDEILENLVRVIQGEITNCQ